MPLPPNRTSMQMNGALLSSTGTNTVTTAKRSRPHSPSHVIKRENSITNTTGSQDKRAKPHQAKILDSAPFPTIPYKHTCTIRETHGRSIFGISFNSINRTRPSDPLLFATTAAHFVTIYQCNVNSNPGPNSNNLPPVVLLQSFSDPAETDEEFYCCAWSRDTGGNSASSWWTDCAESREPRRNLHPHQAPLTGFESSILPPHQQLVAAAGKRGVIRIICPSMTSTPASLVGHGSSINELRFHPRDPTLLFSFSKDYTVRLWNIATHVLICIFGGIEGHRAEVLHGDLSLSGDLLLTAGMDHCIKIWRLNTPDLANAVIDSFAYRARYDSKPYPVIVQHFPEFSCRDVHGNYVDCVRWFGSLVISKSCENTVTFWKPGGLPEDSENMSTNSILPLTTNTTEVGGIRLPSPLQPTANVIGWKGKIHSMPGVPTEHKSSVIHQLKAPECNLWYIRFDVDLENQILALGTGTGPARVYLWDLKYPERAFNLPAQILNMPSISGTGAGGVPLSHSAIRQTRFANNGNTLLCVGDNGLILRFDKPISS